MVWCAGLAFLKAIQKRCLRVSKIGKTANTIKNRAYANDVFYTPPGLVNQLLKHTPIHPEEFVLDPFSGDGAFFNAFDNRAKDWCEIELDKDFFGYDVPVDWVVSNPPFSLISETLDHTCKIATTGFAYIMPTYSLTHNRINRANGFGFKLSKLVFFPTPKNWNLGFQMCYAVFLHTRFELSHLQRMDSLGPAIVTLDMTEGIQTRLI